MIHRNFPDSNWQSTLNLQRFHGCNSTHPPTMVGQTCRFAPISPTASAALRGHHIRRRSSATLPTVSFVSGNWYYTELHANSKNHSGGASGTGSGGGWDASTSGLGWLTSLVALPGGVEKLNFIPKLPCSRQPK